MNTVILDIEHIYRYKTERKSWQFTPPEGKYYLAYQLSGDYEHTFSSEVLTVKADTLFFIREQDAYRVSRNEYGESLCVTFAANTTMKTAIVDCKEHPEIKKLFYRLLTYKNINVEENQYYATAILYEILAFMEKNKKKDYLSQGIRGKISEAYRLMREHYTESDFSTLELVENSGVSPKYFRETFKKMYGNTLTQCLTQMRLNLALELLGDGRFSISQIAEMVGFTDVYYFSKVFKKHMMDSPSKFMNRLKKK